MRPEEIPEIIALPLFAAMEETSRDQIFSASFLQVFPPALTLIETGGRADFLHVLVDGLVELFTVNGTREVTMQLVRPVSSFILAAAYTDERYLMSARTLTSSRILMIPSPLLRTAIARDGALAAAAMSEIAARYRSMVRSLTDMKLRQTLERLANFLLIESERQGAAQFRLPAEKRVIASLLGMRPENLSRACNALEEHGALISGPAVEIVDRAKLAALACPDPVTDRG
jgi:CRP/FNR family transcriptional activator FtrB